MAVRGSVPGGPSLLPAVELVTAWLSSKEEPAFYWSAAQRVMADITDPEAGPDALAGLIFALSSLGGILLDELVARTGADPAPLLAMISLAHGGR